MKAIDQATQGSLNDSGFATMYQIEPKGRGSIDPTKGQSLIPSKSGVSRARALMNRFVATTIKIEHNKDPVKSAFGDHILIGWEGLLSIQMGGLKLNEKAKKDGVRELYFSIYKI